MMVVVQVLVGGLVGALGGHHYFAALWRSLATLPAASRPTAALWRGFATRAALVGVMFAALAVWALPAVFAALFGFLGARRVAVARVRRGVA